MHSLKKYKKIIAGEAYLKYSEWFEFSQFKGWSRISNYSGGNLNLYYRGSFIIIQTCETWKVSDSHLYYTEWNKFSKYTGWLKVFNYTVWYLWYRWVIRNFKIHRVIKICNIQSHKYFLFIVRHGIGVRNFVSVRCSMTRISSCFYFLFHYFI